MVTVLYIEDDTANTELIRRYLGAIDCDLIAAHDGGSGITLAADHQPDMILLDMYLPDIHGLEVAEQIKSMPNLASIPLVALTTDDSPDLKNECFAHGFVEVLHKPVRPQRLLDVVQDLT